MTTEDGAGNGPASKGRTLTAVPDVAPSTPSRRAMATRPTGSADRGGAAVIGRRRGACRRRDALRRRPGRNGRAAYLWWRAVAVNSLQTCSCSGAWRRPAILSEETTPDSSPSTSGARAHGGPPALHDSPDSCADGGAEAPSGACRDRGRRPLRLPGTAHGGCSGTAVTADSADDVVATWSSPASTPRATAHVHVHGRRRAGPRRPTAGDCTRSANYGVR